MSTPIELQGVSKVYQTERFLVQALTDIELNIEPGEFTVLAGPSGSGKSTLLHLVGALDRPTRGKILVNGQELGRLSQDERADFRLRKVSFIFQTYNLIAALTAFENVEYPLLLLGANGKERRERATYFLERVGLSEQLHRRPDEMSGGQRQRIAVARAFATRPAIILADEPTANLDSHAGAHLIDLSRELNHQFKTTFLVATHDSMVIERADRVIRLHDGKVV